MGKMHFNKDDNVWHNTLSPDSVDQMYNCYAEGVKMPVRTLSYNRNQIKAVSRNFKVGQKIICQDEEFVTLWAGHCIEVNTKLDSPQVTFEYDEALCNYEYTDPNNFNQLITVRTYFDGTTINGDHTKAHPKVLLAALDLVCFTFTIKTAAFKDLCDDLKHYAGFDAGKSGGGGDDYVHYEGIDDNLFLQACWVNPIDDNSADAVDTSVIVRLFLSPTIAKGTHMMLKLKYA